jgi:hypothetical protein
MGRTTRPRGCFLLSADLQRIGHAQCPSFHRQALRQEKVLALRIALARGNSVRWARRDARVVPAPVTDSVHRASANWLLVEAAPTARAVLGAVARQVLTDTSNAARGPYPEATAVTETACRSRTRASRLAAHDAVRLSNRDGRPSLLTTRIASYRYKGNRPQANKSRALQQATKHAHTSNPGSSLVPGRRLARARCACGS